jgi:hypothetical protein
LPNNSRYSAPEKLVLLDDGANGLWKARSDVTCAVDFFIRCSEVLESIEQNQLLAAGTTSQDVRSRWVLECKTSDFNNY